MNVLELGSGAGLTGMIASQFAKRTILSDHMEQVIKLMRKNIASFTTGPEKLLYAELDWFK